MVRGAQRLSDEEVEAPLSGRQVRVLAAYVVHGGIKETAAALGMTRSSVHHILEDVRKTLGCSTTQAIALGVQDGWLPFERPKGNHSVLTS